MSMKRFLIVALLAAPMMLSAANYKVDGAHSTVEFAVKHMMVSTVKGKFGAFDGEFEMDSKKGTISKLSGTVDVASIDTGIEKRDGHLKSPDFFDVEKFPTMKLVAKSIKKNKITADLTIKGVTKSVVFDYDFGGSVMDGKKVGFTLEGKIKRADFGITWNKAIEAGGVAVGDEVKIVVEVEGDLQ